MKRENIATLVFAGVMGGAVAFAIGAEIARNICVPPAAGAEFGCIEFWANRYQTTLQTAATTLLTAAGLVFVVRQLRELTLQNRMTAEALKSTLRAERLAQKTARIRAAFAMEAYAAGAALLYLRAPKMIDRTHRSVDDAQYWTDMRVKQVDISSGMVDPNLAARWESTRREFDLLFLYFNELKQGRTPRHRSQVLRPTERLPATSDEAMLRLALVQSEMMSLRESLLTYSDE